MAFLLEHAPPEPCTWSLLTRADHLVPSRACARPSG